MSRFTDAALRLSGVAGALGWTPDGFWRATPAELAALLTALDAAPEAGADSETLNRLREQYPDG